MSEETFHVLQKLNGSAAEKQVVLQCAPLLTGIKMSNLLNVRADLKDEVFRMFEHTPVSCRVLYEFEGRISVLLYREKRLRQHIGRPAVKELLESFGYGEMDLERILHRIALRYQKHMEGLCGFPHEIGLLLGYPPVDVSGFIEKDGRDFLYAGYWKVYGNLKETLKLFEKYDQAREAVIRMAGSGVRIRDMMAAR